MWGAIGSVRQVSHFRSSGLGQFGLNTLLWGIMGPGPNAINLSRIPRDPKLLPQRVTWPGHVSVPILPPFDHPRLVRKRSTNPIFPVGPTYATLAG